MLEWGNTMDVDTKHKGIDEKTRENVTVDCDVVKENV